MSKIRAHTTTSTTRVSHGPGTVRVEDDENYNRKKTRLYPEHNAIIAASKTEESETN
jgi:hypothetical protein